MKKIVFAFCLGLFVLGASGSLMGSGYLVNKRVRKEDESDEYYREMVAREQKTGWASVAAGFAVMMSAVPAFRIISSLLESFRKIEQKLGIE